jgi:hypothetical protein
MGRHSVRKKRTDKVGHVYRKGKFKVVPSYTPKGEIYYTIVNTKLRTHCHVHRTKLKEARLICYRAFKNEVPEDYPEWMKVCIRRIL